MATELIMCDGKVTGVMVVTPPLREQLTALRSKLDALNIFVPLEARRALVAIYSLLEGLVQVVEILEQQSTEQQRCQPNLPSGT